MDDFGRWLASGGKRGFTPQPPPAPPQPIAAPDPYPIEVDSPDGSLLRVRYFSRCASCDNEFEILWGPEEHTREGNYCGGSSRCIP